MTYYERLREAAPAAFDVREAARLELDWWQARREAVALRSYGVTVAAVAALTYGKRPDDPSIKQSGIERQLLGAYKLLKTGVGGG